MAEQKSAGEKRLTKFRDFMPALPPSSAIHIIFLLQNFLYRTGDMKSEIFIYIKLKKNVRVKSNVIKDSQKH